MTVRLTVGAVLVEPALLETTPLVSTPRIVKVYVFAGVVPLGVVVDGVLVVFAQAGSRRRAALTMNKPITPHAVLDRFPPIEIPRQASPSIGMENHSA